MNETKKNRKDWIKNITIIFLIIMLLLTFFSNTIMNYSLPEVATQYVQPGTINAKIRGTGTLEAEDPYKVSISESRKIASVAVKEGDIVEKDQVLFVLEDSDSTEVDKAEAELETLLLAYQQKILAGDISDEAFANAISGSDFSIEDYQARIAQAKSATEAAQLVVDTCQTNATFAQKQIDVLAAVDDTKSKQTAAVDALKKIQDTLDDLNSVSGNSTSDKEYYEAKRAAAQLDLDNANSAVKKAQDDYTQMFGGNAGKVSANELKILLIAANDALTKAKADFEKAKLDQTASVTDVQAEVTLSSQQVQIAEKQAEIEKLKAKAVGATVTAPVAGTIQSVKYVAGESVTPLEAMATIQVAGKDFTLSFSATAEQAKKISIGDKAELQNAWYYTDIDATLTGIKPDTTDPAKKKLLVFTLKGPDLQSGASVSLEIGEKSAQYDLVVPNSAIREDNNGKFVLIVESKSSPLGNRYMATRVDVEVVAADDTQTAITGSLYGNEYVITTATKPVEAGKQVRLTE